VCRSSWSRRNQREQPRRTQGMRGLQRASYLLRQAWRQAVLACL
jgi:hypothetical protein